MIRVPYRLDQYDYLDGVEPLRTYRQSTTAQYKAYSRDGRRVNLPYEAVHSRITSLNVALLPNKAPYGPTPDSENSYGGASEWASVAMNDRFIAAQNAAYLKMVDKVVGARSALSTTLIEGRQALDMIYNRSTQMTTAFRNLARGRFRAFLQDLHIKKALPKHHGMRWNNPKDASGLWLEYHFGWSPLLADISTAVGVLQDTPLLWRQRFRTVGNADFDMYYRQAGRGPRVTASGPCKVRCLYQLVAEIKNPNYNLAKQLGFTNPGAIIWESVPFSWLIDWFYPVGNFLASANDFYGIHLDRAFSTRYYEAKTSHRMTTGPSSTFNLEYIRVKRTLGTLGYHPQFVTKRLSFTRAATAVAVLIQVFKRKLA